MKEVNKIIVGKNTESEKRYLSDVEAKINAFNDVLEYCEQYVPIEDKQAFERDILGYFIEAFDKFPNDLPRIISIDKRLELMDISQHKLQALSNKYYSFSDVELDIDTMEAVNVPDFNVYLEGKEKIERWNKLQLFIQVIDELKELGIIIYPVPVSQASSQAVVFDFKENRLKPNYHYVNGNSRLF